MTKAKRAAYGKPSRPDQVNARQAGSPHCREAASVISIVRQCVLLIRKDAITCFERGMSA